MVMLAEISTRYDPAGRLDTVSLDGVVIADYGYDSNSNRIAVTQVGAGVPGSGCAAGLANVSATVDAQDRLLTYGQCSYSYGANGELATKTDAASAQTTDYQYDSFGNLRQVILPDARAITYQIDGQHRRIGKAIDGQPVQGLIYMNALEPVAETDGDGNLVSVFVYAERPNTPSYLLKAGQLYRIISDHLGSVRLVVNTTDGSIAQRMDYDAWGRITEDTSPGFQPFGFAGGIVDQDTGLVRFGARDYDPETGRWTAKDPIDFGGGDANIYNYVGANPVNAIDPFGLFDLQNPADWPSVPQPILDGVAGFGDTASLGLTDLIRDASGIDGGIDKCSSAFRNGALATFALGGARLAYAGLAKGASVLASSGRAASAFRSQLRVAFGGGKGLRPPNLTQYPTDSALRAAAGRTNPWVNAYGASAAAAGGSAQ